MQSEINKKRWISNFILNLKMYRKVKEMEKIQILGKRLRRNSECKIFHRSRLEKYRVNNNSIRMVVSRLINLIYIKINLH